MFVLLFLSLIHSLAPNQCTCTKNDFTLVWSVDFSSLVVAVGFFLCYSQSPAVLKCYNALEMFSCMMMWLFFFVYVSFFSSCFVFYLGWWMLRFIVGLWFFFRSFIRSSCNKIFFCFLIYFGTHSQIEWAGRLLFPFLLIQHGYCVHAYAVGRRFIRLGKKCTVNIILIHFFSLFLFLFLSGSKCNAPKKKLNERKKWIRRKMKLKTATRKKLLFNVVALLWRWLFCPTNNTLWWWRWWWWF